MVFDLYPIFFLLEDDVHRDVFHHGSFCCFNCRHFEFSVFDFCSLCELSENLLEFHIDKAICKIQYTTVLVSHRCRVHLSVEYFVLLVLCYFLSLSASLEEHS